MKSAQIAKRRLIAVIHDDRMRTLEHRHMHKLQDGSTFSMVMRRVTYGTYDRKR